MVPRRHLFLHLLSYMPGGYDWPTQSLVSYSKDIHFSAGIAAPTFEKILFLGKGKGTLLQAGLRPKEG